MSVNTKYGMELVFDSQVLLVLTAWRIDIHGRELQTVYQCVPSRKTILTLLRSLKAQ